MLSKNRIIEFLKEIINEKDNTIKDLIRINENNLNELRQLIYVFRKYIEREDGQDTKNKRN